MINHIGKKIEAVGEVVILNESEVNTDIAYEIKI
jgi:hypothetical protein